MKAMGRYTATATVIVAILGGLVWPFLDAPGRTSLLVAAAVALPIQVGAFYLVASAVGDQNRFLVRWGVGMALRMVVVAAIGLSLPRLQALDGTVLVLAVCTLFFGLLLIEPAFFRTKEPARLAQ